MSFYGNIKRVDSSPFIFDKIYQNRAAMDEECTSDGVYIGRYVLVKYTYDRTQQGENQYFSKYVELPQSVSNNEETNIEKTIDSRYEANTTADIERYGQTYDNTVWQKIYSVGVEKYIMIAELNAATPRISLDIINPKYLDENIEEQWHEAEVNEAASSEDLYIFKMPDVLKLEVGNVTEDFYGIKLMNPSWRTELSEYNASDAGEDVKYIDTLGPADYDPDIQSTWNYTGQNVISHSEAMDENHNFMRWTNLKPNGTPALEAGDKIAFKKLDTKLYAFGQMISDMYDILYGKPSNGTGPRPFFVDDQGMEHLLEQYDKGLVGILASIASENRGDASQDIYGNALPPGMSYYFTTKWADAAESPDSFIENIPRVVGVQNDTAGSHFYINLEAGKLYLQGQSS